MLPIRTINPGEVYYPLPKTPPVKPVEPVEGIPGMNNDNRSDEKYDSKSNSEKQNCERQQSQPQQAQPSVDITKLLKEAFPYDSAARFTVQQALIGSKLDITADGLGFKKPQKLDILVDGFGFKEKRLLDVYY